MVDPTTGLIVPLGTPGELMIRGYCVMLEYWQDEAKTRECITKDRWYKTGYVWASSSTVDFQHERTKLP